MKMTRLHQPGDGAVQGQRGAGVAGRGAGGPAGADDPGVAEGGRHAVVLETARGVHPFVLQIAAGRAARPRTGPRRGEECSSVCPSPTVTHCSTGTNGSSSWNRHTPLKQCGSLRRAHFSSKAVSDLGSAQPRPVVGHVQQAAATLAGDPDLVDGIGRPAWGEIQRWKEGSVGGMAWLAVGYSYKKNAS